MGNGHIRNEMIKKRGADCVPHNPTQVTMGEKSVAKGTANKLRRVGDSVVVGFAGSTADAMTLMDKYVQCTHSHPHPPTYIAQIENRVKLLLYSKS